MIRCDRFFVMYEATSPDGRLGPGERGKYEGMTTDATKVYAFLQRAKSPYWCGRVIMYTEREERHLFNADDFYKLGAL